MKLKFVASIILISTVFAPFTALAAVDITTTTAPGSQISSSPATVQPTTVPTNNLSANQQLTYVRSNMDTQSQWFLYISGYLKQVSDYILNIQPEKTDISGTIAAYSAALQKVGEDMKARQQVIPLDQAIMLSGFGLNILADSLVLAATALNDVKGSDEFFFPSMSLIGESLKGVGNNIMAIGYLASTNNGNIDVPEYQKQMDAAVFLYESLQMLFTSRERTSEVKADLKNNLASKATNSTFQVINFDASGSQDPIGTIPNPSGFFWDFGDGYFGQGSYISHTYQKAGTYLVKLMVRGPSGFSATTAEVKITPVFPVAVVVTDKDSLLGPVPDETTLTASEPITISGLSSYDPANSGKLKLTWDFGDGKQDNGEDNAIVTHAYDVPGSYDLVLRVESGGLAGVAKKKIKVLSSPPSIKMQVRTATQPAWSRAEKTFFSQNIFGATDLDFTAQESIGALVPGFNARTKIVSAEWDFGDATEIVTQDQNALNARQKVTHTYQKAGTYTVTLRMVDEAQNIGQVTKTLLLNDTTQPSADFDFQYDVGTSAVTTATRVAFDASGSSSAQGVISRYDWKITSAANEVVFSSQLKQFPYSFPKPGRYDVSLQVSTNLGSVSGRVSQQFVVSSSAPLATFDFSFDPYIPNKVIFDASGSSDPDSNDTLSYSWDFNSDGKYDLSGNRESKITKVLDSVGANTVTLQVTDASGLTTTAQKVVTIGSLLVSSMKVKENTPALGIAPFTIMFEGNGFRSLATRTDTNSITRFVWDFGDGSPVVESTTITQGVQLQSHVYQNPGRYLATLKVFSQEGEEALSAYPVYVGDGGNPIASVFYTPSFPLKGSLLTSFTFDGSSSVNTQGKANQNLEYSWDFGDASALANGAVVTHSYTKPGTYTVTLTVTDTVAGRINRTQVQAVVQDLPAQARFVSSPISGSAPLTVQFDASSSVDVDSTIIE
nr:PKD domain-containing protein [Candidatus Gracilibacteria bacterium]